MTQKTTLILAIILSSFGFAQTTLSVGDIAITGLNSRNSDQFSFVLLTDVLSGTEINFTDAGWLASGGFRNYNTGTGEVSEGVVTWTATTDLPCGTQVVYTHVNTAGTFSVTLGSIAEVDTGFELNAGQGDQIIAYQGTLLSPTFLYAVHYGNTSGWSDATSPNTSALPTGLTNAVNAIDLGDFENATHNCTGSNVIPDILLDIANVSNWTFTNTVANRLVLGTCTYLCSCLSTNRWSATGWSAGIIPDLTTAIVIDANYSTLVDGNIQACNLTVNAGATLFIDNGTFAEIGHNVVVNGNLIVESSGSFVQDANSGTFTLNTGGYAAVNKITPPKANWYYYTYWSSPVTGETVEDAFPNVDGDRRFSFNAANFSDTNGDNIDDNGDDWQYALAGTVMVPGVGYAATEARLFMPGASGSATFEGPFNTGDIDVNITSNPANLADNWNFIGNPYASAIDFDAFYAANNTIVDGAAYFWSQASPPSAANAGNEKLNFSQNDYAVYAAGAGGGTAGGTSTIPNGFVPSGQGFFIAGINDGIATFTNAMRVADITGASNSQFFKGNTSKSSADSENRLWIDLTSDNGAFNQILMTYVENATAFDDGLAFDATKIISYNAPVALYTQIPQSDKKYVIQSKGSNSITEDEIFNLGFSTTITVETTFKLAIAKHEGNFLTQHNIYLKDNLTNTFHNLSESDYEFTSDPGEFNERFQIMFSANALSTSEIETDTAQVSITQLDSESFKFSSSTSKITSITVFDLLGRNVQELKGSKNIEVYKLNTLSNAIYVAKIKLENGLIISKKFVKNN